jgi:phenylpropionate dioxygenase-like ring-hydroxylating dioxygenase large terminal subunit
MIEAPERAGREPAVGAWPRYDAAALGFREYWYPVLFAHQVGRRPRPLMLCGERLALVRDGGRVYALQDRCAHRGVPLSAGRHLYPGLITCAYHGWCYDLASGDLVAALTDGPDSPVCGKANVRVRAYPVEERAGVIWVWAGAGPPPPVEEDVPEELLAADAVVEGLVEVRRGNWRDAAENSVDEGHARYLHRDALWNFFREVPAWTRGVDAEPSPDGRWLQRVRREAVFGDEYPRIGRWPRHTPAWKSRGRGATGFDMRLPGILRVRQRGWTDYQIFVPVDADRHRAMFLAVRWTRGADAWLWRLRFRTYIRALYYGGLNRGQDQGMIALMDTPPERLYRPDVSITSWRKWCHDHARRAPGEA